jgi:hypothetical protein
MDGGDRWLSYRDTAQALGMTPAAVAARARRARWPKRLREDGAAEILVPRPLLESGPTSGDMLEEVTAPIRRPSPTLERGSIQASMGSAVTELSQALQREHAARQALQAQVDALREELAAARLANAVAQQQISAERERRERAVRQLAPLERKLAEYEDRLKPRGFFARLFGR